MAALRFLRDFLLSRRRILVLAGITATLKSNAPVHNGKSSGIRATLAVRCSIASTCTSMCGAAILAMLRDRADGRDPIDSERLLAGVLAAREFRSWRRAALGDGDAVDVGALLARCRMAQRTRDLLETVSRTQLLSGRGITRALMVARTIADIAESKSVAEEHLMEALSFKLRKGV